MMFIFKFFLKAKDFPIPKDSIRSLFLVKRHHLLQNVKKIYFP
jgi:hypothetical protein